MFKLIKTQLRVIHALALREIQSQQASLVYGYGWVMFDAFLGFSTLLVMKFAVRGFNRPGVPPMNHVQDARATTKMNRMPALGKA